MDHTDPRLTDEQLMATFTPQQWEFYHWYNMPGNSLTSMISGGGDPGLCIQTLENNIRQRFPTIEEIKAYADWEGYWCGRHRRRLFDVEWSVEDFINLIKTTAFNNEKSVDKLAHTMNMGDMPSIYLGTSNFGGKNNAYGISLGNAYLWPHLDMGSDEAQTLHSIVLGINLNVPIYFTPSSTSTGDRRRREQRSSGEDSVESAESDDVNHAQGFTFVQIGALCVVSGDKLTDLTDDEFMDEDWDWHDTGFGVVVEVKPNAQLGAVWAIYGFHKLDENNPPNRPHIPLHESDGTPLNHIGRLYEDSTERFTVAKIAERLEDLARTRHPFGFQVESTRECQLVRAKLLGIQENVSRVYIDKERQHVRG